MGETSRDEVIAKSRQGSLLRAGIQGPINVGAPADGGPSPAELGARGPHEVAVRLIEDHQHRPVRP